MAHNIAIISFRMIQYLCFRLILIKIGDIMEKWKQDILKYKKQKAKEIEENNNNILQIPVNLTIEEKNVYQETINNLKESINYKLSHSDIELIWQYCQLKIMRDRAWKEYNINPTRYIRIVTGICSDGRTPKIIIKENEHYKTLIDCNKQLEKILKDLKLTPDSRIKQNIK